MRSTAILSLSLCSGAAALQLTAVRPVVRPAVARRLDCDIVCGWGPDPVWTANKIETITEASNGLKAITIVPPTKDDFTIPGQYLQIKEPGAEKAGIFAIASAPGKEGAFEFLIKEQPPSDWSPGTGSAASRYRPQGNAVAQLAPAPRSELFSRSHALARSLS